MRVFTALASPRIETVVETVSPGSITNLIRGRMSLEEAVRTIATRVIPSFPGCSFVMQTRDHLLGGDVSESEIQ